MIFLWIFLLVFATEATAEIITSSELTDPIRRWWKLWTIPVDRPPPDNFLQYFKAFIDKLVSCGYCTSVWTAGFFALFAPVVLDNGFWNWLVMVFALHRLANWLHVLFERIKKGRVIAIELELSNMLAEPEEDENGES